MRSLIDVIKYCIELRKINPVRDNYLPLYSMVLNSELLTSFLVGEIKVSKLEKYIPELRPMYSFNDLKYKLRLELRATVQGLRKGNKAALMGGLKRMIVVLYALEEDEYIKLLKSYPNLYEKHLRQIDSLYFGGEEFNGRNKVFNEVYY